MHIVVRQISGLGNQLFQYAAARYYAQRHAATVHIAIDPPENAHSHGYPRAFLLPHFATAIPLRPYTLRDRLLLNQRPTLAPIFTPLRRTLGVQLFTEPIPQRYTFLESLPLAPATRTLYLSGYWQSWQLVAAVALQLRSELQLRHPPTGQNLATFEAIQAAQTPVSLHIRRGDYTLAAEGNIALPLAYYTEAIAHIQQRLPTPRFFVFSDDIPFARANLPPHLHATFVDGNDSSTAHEDLRLMSACRHHIIANSSFSWWGAWLNPSAEKIVVAPRLWLNRPGTNFPGLLPPDWILLG